MTAKNDPLPTCITPPSAAGPAGAQFEGKIGAFYFLSLLASAEPRGLPGATLKAVRFQQAANGRPFDDVTIEAANADGSVAFLDIQAKRTIDFVASNNEFADVVRRLWATARKPQFTTSRYEVAVAIARTSTRIERHCQEVLHWARQLTSSAAFATNMLRQGFSSKGMRDFVDAFRHHLTAAGAPTDDDTVWRLLRRFQILVFDFESTGSDYDHRSRERSLGVLAPDQTERAADLWSVLITESLTRDAAGGDVDRRSLVGVLSETHGFRISDRPDLRAAHSRLTESANNALADIKDHIGGARLSRTDVVEQGYQALEQAKVVQIVGTGGVGKSAILKSLVGRLQCEGTVLFLAPGRIVGGGWIAMAQVIGCPGTVSRNELMNELGCGGGATLFVDNIDQIGDAAAWTTLRDLLRGVVECPGWRAVLTVRSDDQEWRPNLPEEIQQIPWQSISVGEISDVEADVLGADNPALSALLASGHPARAIARNLFYLSRMADLIPPAGQPGLTLANETDLAGVWWQFGGGRSANGKFERLKLLRAIGEQLIRQPGLVAFNVDELEAATIEELLRVESLREDRAGATVAFWHDTLRDWTIGFLLDEKPELLTCLSTAQPLPGVLSRGLEIVARLALQHDATGAQWLGLLAHFERDDCHGSWRRPILLALTRSENAMELLNRVEGALLAERGRRLKDLIHLMIAVESEPLAQVLARVQPSVSLSAVPSTMVVPTGSGWPWLIFWVITRADRLPSAVIPEVATLFQMWLMVTQANALQINAPIVCKLYDWLTSIEEALRPVFGRDVDQVRELDLDFDNLRQVHEDIRMTFLAFCHLAPESAEKYLRQTDHDRYEAREILRNAGPVAKAAPAALADFALAVIIPDDRDDDLCGSRRQRHDPFDLIDTDFVPTSPGQGPFFQLLESSADEGLRLVRGIVEYATNWHREGWVERGWVFPSVTIPFPDGPKSFEGTFGIYQWARGGSEALIAASALMALEAWAHRQIEGGRLIGDVLHDVLGPSGSSIAFVCVAVDLVLSHWSTAKDLAWPMVATPELLFFDQMRFNQDTSGIGRLFMQERESAHWPVKIADLVARGSRRCQLIDRIGEFALYGPIDIHGRLREALAAALAQIEQVDHPSDNDQINGLRATARRALRMTDASNWKPATFPLADGREYNGYQYQLPPAEDAALETGRAHAIANVIDANLRLSVQKALMEPTTSTPDIVAQAIEWAKSKIAAGTIQAASDGDAGDFEIQWDARVVVMTAAVSARDYNGADRASIEAWAQPILDHAATEEISDIEARASRHIYSNVVAIAAVGIAGLHCRNRDTGTRNTLLTLAARQDHAVLHALGDQLAEFNRIDKRLARSLTRIILTSSVHPRRSFEPTEEAANTGAYRRHCTEAINAEIGWLDGPHAEPVWPELELWHSRPRRHLRLGRRARAAEASEQPSSKPEMYVDEHTLGIWIGHLIRLAIGDVDEWVISLAQHLMAWTIEANNGPPGSDDEQPENRPDRWNMGYFDFLGILCVALPFKRAQALFLEPITRLHEEAFHDALGSFLRGFDRATLASDTKEPEDPRAVRALFADRLREGRMVQRLNYEVSFRAESHLADALKALFYQPSKWDNSGQVHIPERWSGLLDCIPVLTPLVLAAPNSGYLAVVFLTLVESYPCTALLPEVVQVVSTWCETHSVGADFWNQHQLGHRVCIWIDRTLSSSTEAWLALNQIGEELGNCLDLLVRSGVASARALETRISSGRK